jgi:Tol biopolymer transport system component
MALSPGTRLGGYEILGAIGAGGMGEVYRARDAKLNRDVAVKVLPGAIASDPSALLRFEREAQAVAALSHPSILAIHDFGREDGTAFAVMELLEGETLRARLQQGPLPQRKAVELAIEILRGLAAAHEKGIVHRDLKPENLFVTKGGRVKVLDFGLARQSAPREAGDTRSPTVAAATEPGTVLGTVGYMSPEQVRGAAAEARSDIFSFGAVVYEMLTGRRAFQKETAAETMTAILREDPPEISSSARDVSPALERVVRRCLEKDPDERFRSAHDVAFALEAVGGSTSSAAAATLRETAPRAKQSRALVAGAAAASLVCGLALGRLLRPAPASAVVSVQPLTYSGRDYEPAVSPDGSTVAFTSGRDRRFRIWLKQVNGGGEVALTSGPDHNPRFSPDGSQILFARDREGVFRVPVLGGEPRKIVANGGDADWAPSGDRIVFVRVDGMSTVPGPRSDTPVTHLLLAPLGGGEPVEVARFEKRLVLAPRFSPDGKTIVVPSFLTGNRGGRLEVIDVAGKRTRTIEAPPSLGGLSNVAWSGPGRLVYAQALAVRYGGGRVLSCDLSTGRSTPVLWTPFETGILDALGPGRLVVDGGSTRENLSHVALDGGTRWLTRGTSVDRQPVFSPDGKWVAFSSNRSGNLDIWETSLETGAVRRLTEDPTDDWDPGFTRDGKLIWSSGRGGHLEVWIADADGSSPRRLSDDGEDAENPTATPDGSIVYVSFGEKNRGAWKVRPDGSGATRLVSGEIIMPEVSPDGTFLAYLRIQLATLASEIRVARVSDGGELPFRIPIPPPTRTIDGLLGRARWMPDGRALAYIGQDENGVNGIYVQDFDPERADTAATRRKLCGFDANAEAESFAVSADGRHVVVAWLERVFALHVVDGLEAVRPPQRRR